jgi:dinuclear metal center YbgI/SA1388 family protein
MPVKCQVIMDCMDRLAPRYLAESWDNVGLLVGNPAQSIDKILVSLDVTEAIVNKAVADGVNLIIAHHPLIFKPFANLRTDMPQGRMLAAILKADMAIFAAHTNLDIASGGVNDILAQKLQLQQVEPLSESYSERLVKLAVFVPKDHVEEVRQAITKAGAGFIGNYSECTFQSEGIGTFFPQEGSSPFIGQQGKLTYTPEIKLETILPEKFSKRVIKAMLRSHPYEEVAFDLYPLNNTGKTFGLGRIGSLPDALSLREFAVVVRNVLGGNQIRMVGLPDKPIRKVAVCGGSGAGLIKRAVFSGADVLITGDLKYHEAQEAIELGIGVIDAGHFATEFPVVEMLADYLKGCSLANKWNVTINADDTSEDIFIPLIL